MLQGFCFVSMYQPSFTLNIKIQRLVLLIYYCQTLTLAFPLDGWNLWTYKDGAFRMTKNLLNMFLIFPYVNEVKSSTLIYVLTLLFSLFNIFMLLTIFLIAKFKNKLSFMLTFTYWYLVIVPKLFFMPQLFIFIGSLSFSQRALLYSEFQFHAFLPISGVGLLIVSFFCFFSSYFIRSTKLQQDNGLIQKFSMLLFIEQCLNVIITCLYFQNRSAFNNVVQLLMMHLYYLSQFINAFYVGTFPPHLSKFCLILISSCQSLLIVITINLASSNNLISEEQILIMWLIFMTFSVSISTILNDRKQIKLLFKQTNVFELQEFVQYVYYMMPELTNKDFKIQNRFIYCIFIQNHEKQCLNCQKIRQSKNKVASKFVFTNVLYCIIKEHLGVLKMVSRSEYEQFEIYYADFLNKIKKQPLLSFVELKVYQLQNSKPSFYFKNTISYFFEELKKIILDTRVQFHSNHHNFEENSLEIKDIIQAYSIEEYMLPKIIELIDQKIRIWNEQINGLDSIYDLEQLIVNYSSKILSCQDLLEQRLQLDLLNFNQIQKARNVIELRVASIFHLIILNDFYSSLQCEQQISEVLAMENSLPNDVISNIDILQDNLCLIMVSMVKNRGYIKNTKKNYIANYFGLDVKEVESINHINLFIPQFIADIHEQFLQSYLETAQSPLFNQYQIVFSKFKNEFVQPQQLKLENNFDFYDDYVVTGCLSKVKETSEFVLFDENGKVLSVTQGFYTDIIQPAFQEELTAQTINQAYIFLFFINIFSILDQQKDNINLSEFLQVELMTTITIFEDLSKIIQFFCENKLSNTTSLAYSLRKSMQKTALMSQTKTYTTKKQRENIQTGRYYVNNSVKISDDIQLFCSQFRTQVSELLQQFNKFSSVQYHSKISLQYRTIGKKSAQRSYFIIEILDYRKKVANATSSVISKQFDSIYNNKNFSSVLTDITTSERIVQKDEYRPNEIIGNSFNHLLSDREQLFGVLNQSFQESQSFGPLSQRANFISPRQHNLDDELRKLELEFQDIRVSFNGGAMVQQYAGEEKEEEDYNNESKSNKPQKSSSEKRQDKSYKMLKLLTTYKDKGIIKERDDHQSYSSKTSGTSKTQYISIIKNFQHSKIMITSLKIILTLTLILFLCALSTIVINTQVIKQQISEIVDSSYSLNAPLFFNRYFFQSYALSWTLLMNGLKIVKHSDFLINQTFSTLKHQGNETFENLGVMYPKFIEIENMGLLNNISIQLLGFPRKTVSYTEFINSIQNTLQYFFQIKYFSDEATDQVLDIDYINSVITLRYNLKYVFDMNKELIQSLDLMSQNIIKDGGKELQSLTIAEICFIFFIHFVSLFFWNKTESQKQQILLINGRLQENSVNDLIYRHLNIKSILQSTDLKKNNWKKQQVCLIFQQTMDNQEAKQQYLDQRYNQLNKTKNDQNKKKGQVGMLNSRLRDTSYSIKKYICYNLVVFLIIASFLLGGYFYQSSLMNNLIPQQKLTLNFVRFSSYLDTLITTGLVLKTQPQVYPGLIAHKFYTQAQFNRYRDPLKQLFHMFLDVYETYDQNLTEIYEGILFSKDIDDTKKELLLGLYESDICQMITEKIPFCQYEQLGELNFIQKYSQYSYQDNNRDYLENGLVGITSSISYFMKTNYDYEIATIEYATDMNELSDLYKTKEFTNIILEHYSSTKETTQQMLEIILSSNEIILDEYLKLITIYYGLIGSALLVLFAFFYYRLLDLTDDNFIHLRLGLTLVPIEVITDQYNIQLIKQLN
ncbi:unnamed protein product (macronuclear) [Paramecium tetraurelia]|uniref:Transmembrane protein n=1 Tax=Paramecium tetraurelia TaxID=5888 RepID=A0C5G8_PARTE|nr:uncharacterized protein GSPATT00006534001 [Paramecium tetraurelia]CAK66035.1 unnamed protein product [Paramecium tetraurelia]|eukprot:XP_001433432.1 hypothetical protein (macronuclear) [Paramecium tetraurelia strain d4-2]